MGKRRSFFKVMAILLIIAFLPTVLSVGASTASTASATNGSFIVELWNGSTYKQVASFSTDEFQKEFRADIGVMTNPQLRIRKRAEGLAFLDSVLLDRRAASGNKKLLKTDFDVQEAGAEGIVLRFTGSFDGNLSLTGRIEPKVIIGEPLMFPFDNTFIDDPQNFGAFFTYELGSNPRAVQVDGKFENLGKAFESRYLVSSTGHPAGYAYIYISNDDEYLYASADFTGDNTFDYGDDFFKMFADVGGTVKEFKQTSNGREYGVAAMQYTDKVVYEHMYYEMKVPLDQFGSANKLQLAFSLYGTFAINSVVSNPASLSFEAGQTANGTLRIIDDIIQFGTLTDGLLTNINHNSPGLTVQFLIPAVQNISGDGYLDVPYTVQCAISGDYTIEISGIDIDGSLFFNPHLQIPVQVTPPVPVSITAQPANTTVAEGQNATFTVAVSGSAPFSYQWEKSTDNGASWAAIDSATSDTLTLSAVAFADSGTLYRCIVNNFANLPETSSVATLTVTPPPITNLPDTYTMYTNGRVTWNPTPTGGTWTWDENFFSATFNSPATFTALKAGTSTITYTVNGVSQSITVTISESELPSTGQDFIWAYVLAMLSAAVMIAMFGISRYKTKKSN